MGELARDPQANPGVRRNAAAAPGELGYKEQAAPILLELAGRPQVEKWVRSDAYQTLKQLLA